MTTKLDKPIRREVTVDGEEYTLVVSGAGMTLFRKRFRNGIDLTWRQIIASATAHGGSAPIAE